jgi:HTH-type transcriptional regulator, competence development regulator
VPEDLGETTRDSFGKRIHELRRERGLTQRQVAAELRIDFTYLSKLENDRGEPPGEELVRRLAELFEVDAEELLAKAGKIPAELRERAHGDLQFATLLRTLPNLTPDELQRVYKSAGVQAKRGKPPRS